MIRITEQTRLEQQLKQRRHKFKSQCGEARGVEQSLFTKMAKVDLYAEYKGVYVPVHLHTPVSLKYYEDFTFRSDDILIITYPKSGREIYSPQTSRFIGDFVMWFLGHLERVQMDL